MGISDDISFKKDNLPTKKRSDKPLGPDEIKIRHSKDEEEDNSRYEHAQMEDDFFDDHKSRYLRQEPEENVEEPENEPEDELKAKYDEEDYHQPKKHGNPMTKWVVLLILVLIALLVWQNWSKISKAIGWGDNTTSNDASLPNYNSSTKGTDYTSSSTGTDTSTSTSTPSTSPATTPSIDKSKITIQILNGNGVKGSAAAVKTQLVNAGFTVDSVKNALKFSYPSSIIYYKTGKSAEADLVKSTLADRQSELTNDDKIVGNYDIVIVVGKT